MGYLSKFFEKRAHPASDSEWSRWFGRGIQTNAGVDVTVDSALTYAAYYACIRVISETIATLPLLLYKRTARGKDRAPELPLYNLLHHAPNPEMTSVEYRETKLAHVLSWGNHYSEIETNGAGKPIALWPLRPDKTEVARVNGQLVYPYTLPSGEVKILPAYRVHHLRGLGNDGIIGYSPVRIAMQAIGLGLGTEEYGARFFGNGARPGLIVRHPGKLSQAAAKRIEESFASDHQGLSMAHRTKVLEEGMDISTIGIPPEEAQFLETRKFQALEIARIFRVPPHMIGDLDRATFSNIEEQSLNFVIYTLRPWLVRDEQRMAADLLSETEQKTLLIEYLVDGLLRGNIVSRYQAHQIAINTGFYTRNEVREIENKNPIDGLDEPLMPLNMVEVGSQPAATPVSATKPDTVARWSDQSTMQTNTLGPLPSIEAFNQVTNERRAEKTGNDRRALMNRNIRLFEDAATRVVKREATDIRKAAKSKLGKRSADSFETWLEGFYKQLREWFPDYFRNIMLTYAETIMASVADELGNEPVELTDDLREWVEGYLANYTEVYAVGGEKQLRALLAESEGDEDALSKIEERMDGWESTKAGKEGFEQAFEAGNALSIFAYAAGGVSLLQWRARGESCPLCRKMNGKRIKIGGSFFQAGDTHEADGVDPLPIVRTIKHGPLHQGCDCTLVAG